MYCQKNQGKHDITRLMCDTFLKWKKKLNNGRKMYFLDFFVMEKGGRSSSLGPSWPDIGQTFDKRVETQSS